MPAGRLGTEVAVVGAGMSGLVAAHELMESGAHTGKILLTTGA